MIEDFNELSNAIASLGSTVNAWRDEIVQIVHTESLDGKIAAAILGKTFANLQNPFIITSIPSRNFLTRKNINTIFIGIDEREIYDFLPFEAEAIFLVNPIETSIESIAKIIILNPGNYGYTKDSSSNSVLAFLLAKEIDTNIQAQAVLALLHANTKKTLQHKPLSTIEELILQIAINRKIVTVEKEFALLGKAFLSVKDALLYSTDPIIPHITGNSNEIEKLLYRAEIENENRKFIDLTNNEITKILNQLVMFLADKNVPLPFDSNLVKEEIHVNSENKEFLTHYLPDFTQAIVDAENSQIDEEIISVLLGNRSSSMKNLQSKYLREKREMIGHYINAKKTALQLDPNDELVVYENTKIPWYKAGTIGKIILQNNDVSEDKIIAIITEFNREKVAIVIVGGSEKWTEVLCYYENNPEINKHHKGDNEIMIVTTKDAKDTIISDIYSTIRTNL